MSGATPKDAETDLTLSVSPLRAEPPSPEGREFQVGQGLPPYEAPPAPAPSPLRYLHFIGLMLLVGGVFHLFLNGPSLNMDYTVGAVIGGAVTPAALASILCIFSFRDRRRRKTTLNKALSPSVGFGFLWTCIWIGMDETPGGAPVGKGLLFGALTTIALIALSYAAAALLRRLPPSGPVDVI